MAPKPPAPISQKDVNQVVQRLSAAGVNLSSVSFKVDKVHPYPLTLYFTCGDSESLVTQAETSPRLGRYDPGTPPVSIVDWRKLDYTTRIYCELNTSDPIRLEIAEKPRGLCRASILKGNEKFVLDAGRMARAKVWRDNDIYGLIAKRLDWKDPPFNIDDHVAEVRRFGPNVLVGIDFITPDPNKLIDALKAQKSGSFFRFVDPNDPTRKEYNHAVLKASLMATKGYGLREAVSDVVYEKSGQPVGQPSITPDLTHFRKFDPKPSLQATALHFAISAELCNVHIDQVAFVFYDAQGNVIVDLERAKIHTVDELGVKTKIPEFLSFGNFNVKNAMEKAVGHTFLDVKANSTHLSVESGSPEKGRISLTVGCENCAPLTVGKALLDSTADIARLKAPRPQKFESFIGVTYTKTF